MFSPICHQLNNVVYDWVTYLCASEHIHFHCCIYYICRILNTVGIGRIQSKTIKLFSVKEYGRIRRYEVTLVMEFFHTQTLIINEQNIVFWVQATFNMLFSWLTNIFLPTCHRNVIIRLSILHNCVKHCNFMKYWIYLFKNNNSIQILYKCHTVGDVTHAFVNISHL